MAGLEIYVLGQFRVIAGGQLVEEARWSGGRVPALLKHLAVAPRREVHCEQLLEALWPDVDYETGVARLSELIDDARRILEPTGGGAHYLHVDRSVVRLAADPLVRIDADVFDRKATLALSFPETASLESAAALYTGDLLAEEPHAEWLAVRRDQLRLLHQRVLAHLKAAGEPHAIEILHQAARGRHIEEDEPEESTPALRRRGLWLWLVLVLGLMAALAAAGWALSRTPALRISSLVVVPLEDEDQLTPLGDGLAEDLRDRLSQVANLRVLAETSVLALRRKRRDPRAIGRELRVENVLTSRLARAGAGLTVTLEMLRVGDGRRIWDKHLATPDGNLLLVDGIVEAALQLQLPPRILTTSPDAYRAYLEGLHWRSIGEDEAPKAVDAFQRATGLDGGFALAWSALAGMHVASGAFDEARAAAGKAIERDERVADAHVAMGRVRMLADWDWPGAEAEFRRAVELNAGSVEAHHGYGLYLAALGQFEAAGRELDRALELDPLSPVLHLHSGYPLYFQGRFDDAITRYRRALELSPGYAAARLDLMDAYAGGGDLDRAVAEGVLYIEDSGDPDLSIEVSEMLDEHGWRRALRVWMTAGEEARESAMLGAHLRALLKDRVGTMQWLESAFEERSGDLATVAVDPVYGFLHGDRQFADLLERLRLQRR